MFSGIVTIEKDAEMLSSNDKTMVVKTRVSYKTRSSFRDIDKKTGTETKTYTQFLDATFFVSKDKDGNTRQLVSDLVKGTVVYIRDGDIGQDVVEHNGKKQWFVKLTANAIDIVGKRQAKGTAPAAEAGDTSFDPSKFAQPVVAAVDMNDEFRF